MISSGLGIAQEKVVLKEVKIAGNLRVEEDGIRLHVKNRPERYSIGLSLSKTIKAIYRMGSLKTFKRKFRRRVF
jgi:hypothetical protein